MVQNWTAMGGVFLIGADAFVRLVKKEKDTKVGANCSSHYLWRYDDCTNIFTILVVS